MVDTKQVRKERGATVGKTASKKSVVKGPPPRASASRNGKVAAKGKPVAAKAVASKASAPAKGKPQAKPVPAKKDLKPAPVKVAARPAPAKPVAGKPAARPAAPAKVEAPAKPVPAVAAKAPAKSRKAAFVLPPVKTIILTKPDKPLPPIKEVKPARVAPKIEPKPEQYRPIAVMEQVNSSGDSKPKKNQAGLTARELEFFRDLLLAKRRELVGDMSSMEREALQSGDSGLSTLPIHMADMGTDNYEQEFTLGLVEKDRTLLREINHALAKLQAGTYGLCEGNGKPITKVRLEAQPWARFSIEYARLQEKSGIRR